MTRWREFLIASILITAIGAGAIVLRKQTTPRCRTPSIASDTRLSVVQCAPTCAGSVTLTKDGTVLHEKGYGPRIYPKPDDVPPVLDRVASVCFFDLEDTYAAPERVQITLTSGERTKTITLAPWAEGKPPPDLLEIARRTIELGVITQPIEEKNADENEEHYRALADGGRVPLHDIATLERSECFGDCPVFGMSVYGDGLVVFEGKAHTVAIGHRVKRVPVDDVRSLFVRITTSNYLSWDWPRPPLPGRMRSSLPTDHSTVITSVELTNGEMRTIRRNAGDPSTPMGLVEIEDEIESFAGEWISF